MCPGGNAGGRVRIICGQHREAKTCDNGRAYYMDAIEQAVIGALREQIGSRDAIGYFIRVYNDERRRASSDAIANRARLEAQAAEAQRGFDRMIDAIAAGTITQEEAAERIPAARAAAAAAKAALAAIGEPPKVISLHPAAVDSYLKNLDRLGELIAGDLIAGDAGLADALREIVKSVSVIPAPAGEAPLIRITGKLESLIGSGPFPVGSVPGGRMVAGARFGQAPPDENIVFMLEKRAAR